MVECPEYLANVIPIPTKDGKVRVCVDFRDPNKASPKDQMVQAKVEPQEVHL